MDIQGYKKLNKIGIGAGSDVYQALRESDDKLIVIKVLDKNQSSEKSTQALENEFKILKKIESSYVPKALDLKEDYRYFILELESQVGQSLFDYLKLKTLGLGQFLNTAISLTRALVDLHEQKIIHQDIKSQNIILIDGDILLIDFGLAITNQNSGSEVEIDLSKSVAGTLAYMSPEQSGRIQMSVDERSDLYSLGITFYEMLTGELPFNEEDSLAMINAHLTQMPKNPLKINASIPKVLSAIVLKLIGKAPESRYQSAYGLLTDLETCLKEWEIEEYISDFEIGLQDDKSLFRIPQKLYGREDEARSLLGYYEQACHGIKQLVLVEGVSGIGKTALINQINQHLLDSHAQFISGKFDQFNRDQPYSAFIQCFSNLVEQLLSLDEVKLDYWKKLISNSLADEIYILTEIIPSMQKIFGGIDFQNELAAHDRQDQLKRVFIQFIASVSQSEHPLVIFLDDVQWIDLASLNLFETINRSDEIRNMLFIVSYRDNEVDDHHCFSQSLNLLEESQIEYERIHLKSLLKKDIQNLVQDTLFVKDNEQLHLLVEHIFSVTSGNPFYVRKFFESLYDNSLIVYKEDKCWHWDLEEIKAKEQNQDIVEFMLKRLSSYTCEQQNTLALAACVGTSFESRVLAAVLDCEKGVVENHLRVACNQALLIKKKQAYFFCHDRVQEASVQLIDDIDRKKFYLKLAWFFSQRNLDLSGSDQVFQIVEYLKHAQDIIDDVVDLSLFAQYSLDAGLKAMKSSAFAYAKDAFEQTSKILDKTIWQEDSNRAWSLYYNCLVASFAISDWESCKKCFAVLGNKNLSKDQRLLFNHLNIKYASLIKKDYESALELIYQSLTLLKYSMPKNIKKYHVDFKMISMLPWLYFKKPADIFKLPECEDQRINAICHLLTDSLPTLEAIDPNLYLYAGGCLIELTFNHGLNPTSAFAVLIHAGAMIGMFKHYEMADQFFQASQQLAKQFPYKEHLAKVKFTQAIYLHHWCSKAPNFEEIHQSATNLLKEVGNTEWLLFQMYFGNFRLFYLSKNLESFHETTTNSLATVNDMKQPEFMEGFSFLVWFQKVLLAEVSTTQEKIKISKFIKDARVGMDFYGYHLFSTLLYLFEDRIDKALAHCIELEKSVDQTVGAYVEPIHRYQFSLVILRTAKLLKTSQRISLVFILNKNLRVLKKAALHCPKNFKAFYEHLLAEQAWVKKSYRKAELFFENALQSIRSAASEKMLVFEGYIALRAAQFYLEQGKGKIASLYLHESLQAWNFWGAKYLVNLYSEKYQELLAKYSMQLFAQNQSEDLNGVQNTTLGFTTIKLDQSSLDTASIVKANQALSKEKNLDQLILRVMEILSENTAAERVCLYLQDSNTNRLLLQGEKKIGHDLHAALQSKDISEQQDVAKSILNFVSRSQEALILSDASQDKKYRLDKYVQAHEIKSLLCAPIMNQGNLLGLIYLENNLSPGVFTQDRVEVLDLVLGQLAVSIENVVLYNEMDQKIKEKTKDIRSILENIELGILTFSSDKKISKDYSDYLRQLFSKEKFEGRDIKKLIFNQSDLSVDDQDRLEAGLNLIGEDIFNFEINDDCFPAKISLPATEQELELDWTAIEDEEGIITKLMLLIRDVTELNRTKLESERKGQELEMIAQVLEADENNFERFLINAEELIRSTRDILQSLEEGNDAQLTAEVGILFRNLHTLKGNSRTYHLDRVTSMIHEAEEFYDGYRKEMGSWKKSNLLQAIDEIKIVFKNYKRIYYDVLKRGDQVAKSQQELRGYIQLLDADKQQELRKELMRKAYSSLGSILEPIQSNLPRLAQKLGKELPEIKYIGAELLVHDGYESKLESILSHIVNNSMDHGLVSGQKSWISFKVSQSSSEELLLEIQDSGRGLNMSLLTQKAQESLALESSRDDEALKELVFKSGLSTKQEVSEVSGRGVGMDSVRAEIESLKGRIEIAFKAARDSESYRPFAYQLTLPNSVAFIEENIKNN